MREKRLRSQSIVNKLMLYRTKRRKPRKKRRWWVAPGHTDNWWINMISGAEEWKKNREDFEILVNELLPFINPDWKIPSIGS